MTLFIRFETPADIAAIHALTTAAFLNAPHASHTEQFIVDALRDAGALAISLVMEHDGKIVGHVALSPVSISDGSSGWFDLGPISVSPEHQGKGIGSRLMNHAIELLRERSASGCVLLGDPAYYRRFGFKPESNLVLPDVPPEYFQALAFSSHLPRGTVTYHPAFNTRADP
jgi:putative acetyltransferase